MVPARGICSNIGFTGRLYSRAIRETTMPYLSWCLSMISIGIVLYPMQIVFVLSRWQPLRLLCCLYENGCTRQSAQNIYLIYTTNILYKWMCVFRYNHPYLCFV